VRLVASLICRNERTRFLDPCINSLLEFVDAVVILDDASDDGTKEWLHRLDDERIAAYSSSEPIFYKHEGRARQRLIDITLSHAPTWVLSLDSDEFIDDGHALRRRLEQDPEQPVWQLSIEEIWTANQHLYVREDGGWRTHGVPFLWKARPGVTWTMRDRKLACGRIPQQVMAHGARAKPSGVSLLHFGWTDPATRRARYDRYTKHDGGKFHASSHLRSIMWPESRIKLRRRSWPEGAVFDGLRERFTVAV